MEPGSMFKTSSPGILEALGTFCSLNESRPSGYQESQRQGSRIEDGCSGVQGDGGGRAAAPAPQFLSAPGASRNFGEQGRVGVRSQHGDLRLWRLVLLGIGASSRKPSQPLAKLNPLTLAPRKAERHY